MKTVFNKRYVLLIALMVCSASMSVCGEEIMEENIPEEYMIMINSLDSLAIHDSEACIKSLNTLLAAPKVPEYEKERLRFMLGAALKNRVGHLATDFKFMLKDDSTSSLRAIKGDYIILYLNDPACDDCAVLKTQMAESQVLNSMLDSGRLKLLSVCVEGNTVEWEDQILPENWIDACDEALRISDREIYDLPTMPVLYLLDKNQRVLLKNSSLEKIEGFLKEK